MATPIKSACADFATLAATQAEVFKNLRDRHAHQLQYLSFDRVVPGSISALENIQASGSELLVMTLRRTCELVLSGLNRVTIQAANGLPL